MYNEDVISDILKINLIRNKKIAILAKDEIFKIIQNSYKKYFASKKNFKIVRCMTLVKDIFEVDHQEQIINDYHKKSNHRGISETLEHLKRSCYFPNMKNTITSIINKCETCATNKYERSRKLIKLEITETPDKPLEILHIDIYSVLGENFLTIIDKFSKFGSAYMLTSKNSLNVLKCLKHFLSHHGIPKKIVVDNGIEFISSIFKDFMELYDIKLHTSTAKSSTGNSPVERFHSTITELIRIIHNSNKNILVEEIMNEAIITYNNSIHSVTKLTPFELKSGHYANTSPFPKNNNDNTNHDYLTEHIKTYNQLCKIIHDKSLNNKKKTIDRLNKDRNDPLDFEPDEIIYETDNRRTKVAPKFIKHKIVTNNKVTVSTNKRKVHKQKIKNKRKFTGT